MVHAPSPVRRRRHGRSPVPGTFPRAASAAVLLAASAAGCGIDNIPTRDEAADLAWTEVQAREAERASLARELEAVLGGRPEIGRAHV